MGRGADLCATLSFAQGYVKGGTKAGLHLRTSTYQAPSVLGAYLFMYNLTCLKNGDHGMDYTQLPRYFIMFIASFIGLKFDSAF